MPATRLSFISSFPALDSYPRIQRQAATIYYVQLIKDKLGLQNATNSSHALDFLKFCYESINDSKENETIQLNLKSAQYQWENIENVTQCEGAFSDFKEEMRVISNLEVYLHRYNRIHAQYEQYQNAVNMIFSQSKLDVHFYPQHEECLKYKKTATDLDNLLLEILQLSINISQANSFEEAYEKTIEIISLYKELMKNDANDAMQMYTNFSMACSWINRVASETQTEAKEIVKEFDTIINHANSLINKII